MMVITKGDLEPIPGPPIPEPEHPDAPVPDPGQPIFPEDE